MRPQIGGVERVAGELVRRLPRMRPDRYRVVAPARPLTGARGHVWEQLALPAIARGSRLILSPANFAPIATRRNVVMIYDVAPFLGRWYGAAYTRWHRAFLPPIARRARLVITASQVVRRQISEVLGIAPDRIEVVPLGVDERFGRPRDPGELKRRLGLERPYVLALGTDLPRKNLAALDRIAPRLAEEGLEVVFGGSTRSYMPTGDYRVRSLGYVPEDDLPDLYAGAAVLAVPSLYEGFGLGCLEAMAAGTPVVTSGRGALQETCGDAAVEADPGDPEAFAAAILRASQPGAEHDELVARGRERVAGYTWAETSERIDRCLDRVLG